MRCSMTCAECLSVLENVQRVGIGRPRVLVGSVNIINVIWDVDQTRPRPPQTSWLCDDQGVTMHP